MKKILLCPFMTEPERKNHATQHKSVLKGTFLRKCDKKLVQRAYCKTCKKFFSKQTNTDTYRQRKPQINKRLGKLLSKGMSQRGCAYILQINRKTVDRRVQSMGKYAKIWLKELFQTRRSLSDIQFDDLETYDKTKLKPLSVPLVIENGTRLFVAIDVAEMPAKGHLSKLSIKKYGPRKDKRPEAWHEVLSAAAAVTKPECRLFTDKNPHYPAQIAKYFPKSTHLTTDGGRGCIAGYGELKKKAFDPMFSLNHTCAMLRDNLACLRRRTWTSTKKLENLRHRLNIYAQAHNERILKKLQKAT